MGALIQAVSAVTLEEFMASFNSMASRAATTDGPRQRDAPRALALLQRAAHAHRADRAPLAGLGLAVPHAAGHEPQAADADRGDAGAVNARESLLSSRLPHTMMN